MLEAEKNDSEEQKSQKSWRQRLKGYRVTSNAVRAAAAVAVAITTVIQAVKGCGPS